MTTPIHATKYVTVRDSTPPGQEVINTISIHAQLVYAMKIAFWHDEISRLWGYSIGENDAHKSGTIYSTPADAETAAIIFLNGKGFIKI